MNQQELNRLIASGGLGAVQTRPVMTEVDRANIERVEDMQVRTQAAAFATQVCAQRQHSLETWDKWVAHIEAYIRHGFDAGPAPVRSRV